jgi:Domain of unknown function (DUF4214)
MAVTRRVLAGLAPSRSKPARSGLLGLSEAPNLRRQETTMKMRRKLPLVALVGVFACAALAGSAAAGTGSPAAVNAVERQPFSGTVATYTSTTTANQRFLAQAYLDLLGRSVGPAELATFGAFLGNGGTRTQVAHALLAGDEYRSGLVGTIYLTFLRRGASPAEVAAGVAFLNAGATDEQLKSFVLGSGEYLATQGAGTVAGFLSALYRDVLARRIDAAAESAFTQALAGGMTRADVALAVLTSVEAREDLVRALYAELLHRSASALEVQGGVDLLANGGHDEDVIEALVGSDEYFTNVPASFASATIDWGDGSQGSALPVSGGTVGGSHTYGEAGTYPLTVVVQDLDGVVTINGTANVADAPLVASPVSFTVAKKTTFTKTVALFTDANAGSTVADFTASIAWGDGSSSTGTVTALPGGGFSVGGSHRYDFKGSYSVAVHVQDVGGSSADTVGKIGVTGK